MKVQYPGVAAAVRADMQNLDMIMRLLKRMAPQLDVKAIATRDPRAHRRGARLRARGPESARAGADLRRPPVHHRARGHRLALARARDGDRVRARHRLRGAQGLPAGSSATASGRSSSASSSAACTATTSSPAIPIPATSCCSTTAASRSWTSASSSAWTPEPVELELAAQRAVGEQDAAALHELLARVAASCPTPSASTPTELLEFLGRRDLVVHTRRRGRADAGDRDAGDDRELRPALAPLPRRCATRTCAPTTSSGGAWRC